MFEIIRIGVRTFAALSGTCKLDGIAKIKLLCVYSSSKRPVNPDDLRISPEEASIQTEVIMDGRVLDGNLKRMGLDTIGLQKQLKKHGYKNPKEIFLGLCDENKSLTLFRNAV